MDIKVTKKLVTEFIRAKLGGDDKWATRGLVVVFNRQTFSEKSAGMTVEHNSVGFTGPDAEFLTSLASQFIRRGSLSPKQMVMLKRMMPKYHGQILDESEKNGKLDVMNRMAGEWKLAQVVE